MVIASLRAITMGLTAKSSALAPRLVTSTPSKCSTIAITLRIESCTRKDYN
ncbi:hypothetical protein PR003_g27652 [Phytophthora rubi]|uniref:Uncharacterized protein n=1 Tax=Phytophthora rubi TaxID=129364 RepID=A0A6A3HSQ0_9STRA|nr:hypothetical protein PR002_g26646 [Phytophthora rubi]KAE8973030.1 hypothetical protein PR001_g26433 [Phytophthora rubi]KAE9281536.1 hypothetical protein PR003_g27652 [Phytophthora rubi]